MLPHHCLLLLGGAVGQQLASLATGAGHWHRRQFPAVAKRRSHGLDSSIRTHQPSQVRHKTSGFLVYLWILWYMRNMLLQHWIFKLLFIFGQYKHLPSTCFCCFLSSRPRAMPPAPLSLGSCLGLVTYSPGKIDEKGIGVVIAEVRKEFGCVSSGLNLA